MINDWLRAETKRNKTNIIPSTNKCTHKIAINSWKWASDEFCSHRFDRFPHLVVPHTSPLLFAVVGGGGGGGWCRCWLLCAFSVCTRSCLYGCVAKTCMCVCVWMSEWMTWQSWPSLIAFTAHHHASSEGPWLAAHRHTRTRISDGASTQHVLTHPQRMELGSRAHSNASSQQPNRSESIHNTHSQWAGGWERQLTLAYTMLIWTIIIESIQI